MEKVNKSLKEKTKEELLDIIFRKDELEQNLRKGIKELQAKLYVLTSHEETSPKIIEALEKRNILYIYLCYTNIILDLILIILLLFKVI